jgi:hypothetical protein
LPKLAFEGDSRLGDLSVERLPSPLLFTPQNALRGFDLRRPSCAVRHFEWLIRSFDQMAAIASIDLAAR